MLLRVCEISHVSEWISGGFFGPVRYLLWGGEANTLGGEGWSSGSCEASPLDTAINTSLIPHVGLSRADNLSGEEFHLWWSPQGDHKELLLHGSQFYLGKGGGWTTGGVRRDFLVNMKQN